LILIGACTSSPHRRAGKIAGSVAILFSLAAVGGFLLYRQYINRQHALAVMSSGHFTSHEMLQAHHHEPVIIKPKVHRNADPTLHHPNYHQPHRFRPRSHNQD